MKKLQCIFFITILIFTTLAITVNAQVETEGNPFVDFDEVSSWAKDNVLQAYDRGLMKGQANNGQIYFNPKGNVTFAEAFAIVMNFVNNPDLDIKENMEKLDYPSVNLWANIESWDNMGQGCYYRIYLMEKYDDYYLVDFYTSSIRTAVPIYYHAISYNDDESEPDDVLKYWNRTSREIAMNGNFAKKTKEDQLKYCFQEDFKRIKNETNKEFKTLLKKDMMFKNYRFRLEVTETKLPIDGVKNDIPNTFEERHEIQIKYINPEFYPNLQNKNHWGYNTYEELMKYMYLNGLINEENITLDTPIRKDQFSTLIYWVLAV